METGGFKRSIEHQLRENLIGEESIHSELLEDEKNEICDSPKFPTNYFIVGAIMKLYCQDLNDFEDIDSYLQCSHFTARFQFFRLVG